MSTATGLTIVKRFLYRGDASEEYSNSYWFKPVDPPADADAWKALFDAVVAEEKKVYSGAVEVIRAYGYDDDTGHKPEDTGTVSPAVWSEDLRVAPLAVIPGTLATTGGVQMPGDDAVWVRWKTQRRTVPGGKPIYLRKYFHLAWSTTGGGDNILAAQKTALLAFGAFMYGGTLPGSRTITTPGRLDTIEGTGASSFITTRTLKRRGKRP